MHPTPRLREDRLCTDGYAHTRRRAAGHEPARPQIAQHNANALAVKLRLFNPAIDAHRAKALRQHGRGHALGPQLGDGKSKRRSSQE